ncbi:aspartyl/asparaginyl beta-hydroxylase domain-containing protein [Vibrio wakamikoensis]|jgi:hypothetical protein|uniref:Aspartyl/asparaginyl beta-hydroxylase domain-containing protein n=1 Tax=Vibrio chaetopteri TaxID=3016528 RepID=A0AAU8BLR6_9VIBR
MDLFARLPFGVDNTELKRECEKLPAEGWSAHVNQNAYHGCWDVMPLRVAAQHVDSHKVLQCFAIEQADVWVDLPRLENLPLIASVLKWIDTPLQSVRLMRLHSKSIILPHRDAGLCHEYGAARLHLPIKGAEQVKFLVDGHQVPMEAGQLWYVNANEIHQVENFGSVERIHLVIDCEVNDWLRRQISQAQVRGVQCDEGAPEYSSL